MGEETSPARESPHTLRRVLGLFRPHRRRVAWLIASILGVAVVGTGVPLLTKLLFDKALFPSSGEPDLGLLVGLVVAMVALVALTSVLGIVQTYLSTAVGQLVMHDLRDRLYRHLQGMSLRFFTGTQTGDLQSRLANDIGAIGPIVSGGLISIATNVAVLAASLAAMAVLSWQLAIVTVPMLVVFAFISNRVGHVRQRYTQASQETLSELTSITQETLSVSGALLGKVFDRHRAARERYRTRSRRLVELRIKEQMAGRVVLGVAQAFFMVAPVLLYLFAGFAIANGSNSITAGTLVAVTALLTRLFIPVRELLDTTIQVIASTAVFDRVFQYLDLSHEIVDAPNARSLDKDDARGAVAFRNVWFRYSTPPEHELESTARRSWTLEDITLDVEPGQLAALVGPSGAGKTTLSYLVARLYEVDRGSVTIDGIDVRNLRLASLAGLIGMVTQETYLLHATIRENLLYARPDAADAELEAAAQLAFIHDRITEFPDGYDTVVGERGYRLSGGEKQRLAIARVILKDPRILILDEATSALDTASERLVQQALQPLMAERTTIAIAHRLSTILAADVIFVLDEGHLIERGTHAELLARGGMYARLYEQQFADTPLVPVGASARLGPPR